MSAVITAGGLSLPHVTNLIAGDGSGGASDSGVNAAPTGAAINPASTGVDTPGTGAFTTLSASDHILVPDAGWIGQVSQKTQIVFLESGGFILVEANNQTIAKFINLGAGGFLSGLGASDLGRVGGDEWRNLALTGSAIIGGGTSIGSIRHGVSGAMTAGAVTVTDTKATTSTRYFFATKALGTVTSPSSYYASTVTASTSFVITSSQVTDTSTVSWIAIEP